MCQFQGASAEGSNPQGGRQLWSLEGFSISDCEGWEMTIPSEVLEAGDALYRHAVDVRIHHDAFMYAWRDKFSPESLKELDKLRDELFVACKAWREVTGREAKDIAP